MKNYKISTMTVSGQFPNCSLNLVNIGKYLDTDNDIIGIKYNFGETSILKGKYSTSVYKKSKAKDSTKINKTLFYNQVSIIVKNLDNNVNVKLFANGSVHMTGIKSESESIVVMKILYAKLQAIQTKTDMILLTMDSNGVYLDSNNMVYSLSEPKRIIGYKADNEVYNIQKKNYKIDNVTKKFISQKLEAKRTRQIIDFSGTEIGFSKIELMKNKTKFYNKNSNIYFDNNDIKTADCPTFLIYYDGNDTSSVIGKLVYYLTNNQSQIQEPVLKRVIEYKYQCNPFEKCNNTQDTSFFSESELSITVNCINIYFKLDFQLNRQRLFSRLLNDNYTCEYKPEKYSGVKFIYKHGINLDNQGVCFCSMKCTCNNVTFLIFQTGNVIVTGLKNTNDISEILNNYFKIIHKYEEEIKKRYLL